MARTRRATALATGASVVLAACGGSGTAGSDAAPPSTRAPSAQAALGEQIFADASLSDLPLAYVANVNTTEGLPRPPTGLCGCALGRRDRRRDRLPANAQRR